MKIGPGDEVELISRVPFRRGERECIAEICGPRLFLRQTSANRLIRCGVRGSAAGLAELETDLGVGLHLGPDEYPARPLSPGDRLWERREDVR
jgi:hypothetical protein